MTYSLFFNLNKTCLKKILNSQTWALHSKKIDCKTSAQFWWGFSHDLLTDKPVDKTSWNFLQSRRKRTLWKQQRIFCKNYRKMFLFFFIFYIFKSKYVKYHNLSSVFSLEDRIESFSILARNWSSQGNDSLRTTYVSLQKMS